MSAAFEDAKNYLQKEVKGSNLYDHLSEVLVKVLAERPEDAVAMFENLSTLVKQQTIAPKGSEGATNDQDPEAVRRCCCCSCLWSEAGCVVLWLCASGRVVCALFCIRSS